MFSFIPCQKKGSCVRCHGPMILDDTVYHNKWHRGLKCLNCGARAPWIISDPPEREIKEHSTGQKKAVMAIKKYWASKRVEEV